MAILDTLVVQLLMDSSGIVKGAQQAQNGLERTGGAAERTGKRLDDVGKKAGSSLARTGQAVEKTGKGIEDVGKKGADSFAAFRREALGAIALFTGGAGIASFTHDIAAANTALGSLSRQLDIAPQKLTQLHEAMKASGGSASDVDGFFKSIQSKASTNEGLAQLTRLSQLTGVDYLDRNGRVRADIFDQLAHSQRFQGLTRAVQDNYIQQLDGNAAVTNLVTRHDYDSLQKRFSGLGPTAEQIRQGEQLLADWTELKANTDQVMQRVFSDLEPSLHNFLQALIALEKAHPKAIADGVAGVAAALSVLSAILTAKSFTRVLGMLGGIRNLGSIGGIAGGAGQLAAGAGAGVTAGIAGAVVRDVQQTGHSPWDQGAGELYAASHERDEHGGPTRTDLENHYLQRTGALTAAGIDWEKERSLWQRETPDERRKLEDADSRRRWGWAHDTLGWIKGALLPNAHADDSPPQSEPGHEIRYVHAPQDAPETPAPERSNQQAPLWPAPPEIGLSAENIDLERLTGAVAMQESGGNANAVSSVGAQGLLQLMPSTARGLGVTDPFDADQSWSAGQKYLGQLLGKYHDQMKALAAYNWGPGNLDKDLKKHGDQWRAYLPRETSDYLMRVGRNYETGNVVHHHNTTTHSPTINVAVNGGIGAPDEIRRMARQGASEALARHETGKIG